MSTHNFKEMLPAYLGDKPYIFISYSHMDSESIKEDICYMNSEGYRIWYDEGIEIGKDWPDELATAIQNCTQFIVYISRHSIKSEHVKDEIFYALNNNKKIVPIYLEELVLPSGLGLKLGSKQGIMQYQLTRTMYNAYLCKALYPECREQDTREPDRQEDEMGEGIRKDSGDAGHVPDSSSFVTGDNEDPFPGRIKEEKQLGIRENPIEGKSSAKRINPVKRMIPGTTGRLIGAVVLIGIISIAIVFTVQALGPNSSATHPASTLQNTGTPITGTENREGNTVTTADITITTNQEASGNITEISDVAGTSAEPSLSPDENSSTFTQDENLEKLLGDIDISVSVDELVAQIRKKMPVFTEVTTRSAIDTTSRGYATFSARKMLLMNRISQSKVKIQNIKDQRLVLEENNRRGKTYITDLDEFNKAELVTRRDNTSKLISYIDEKLEFDNLSADEKSLILKKKEYLLDLDKEIRTIIQEVTDLRARQNDKIAERDSQDKTLESELNELTSALSELEKELEALNTAEQNTGSAPKYTGGN